MRTFAIKRYSNHMAYAFFMGLSFVLATVVFMIDSGANAICNHSNGYIGVIFFAAFFSVFPIFIYKMLTKGRACSFTKWFLSLVLGYAPLMAILYCIL
ncbi:MAG: hypothetical protein ACEPOV_10715 [Hyphomicrobiales bacterium]